MLLLKKIITCFFIVIGIIPTMAQDFFYKKISKESGAPGVPIYNLYAGNKGYLYIGTELGLYRYNGRIFKQIPYASKGSLAGGGIVQDDQGIVYFMNFSNEIFKVQNDSLFKFSFENKFLDFDNIIKILIVKDQIWLLSYMTITVLDYEGNLIKNSEISEFLSEEMAVFSDMIAIENEVWIAAGYDKLLQFKGLGKPTTHLLPRVYSKHTLTQYKNEIISVQKNSKKPILLRYNIKTNERIALPIALPKGAVIYRVKSLFDHLYICTSKGLLLVADEKGFLSQPSIYFPDTRISDIATDFEGDLWAGSIEGDLYFVPRVKTYQVFNPNTGKSFGPITCVLKNDSNDLIVSELTGEIHLMDKKQNKSYKLQLPSGNNVQSLSFEDNQILTDEGLVSFENNKFIINALELGNSRTLSDEGDIFVSGSVSTYLITQRPDFHREIVKKLGSYFEHDKKENYVSFVLDPNRSRDVVYNDDKKILYSATIKGLVKLDLNIGEKIYLKTKNRERIVAKSLYMKGDSLWVGTLNDGVLLFVNDRIQAHYKGGSEISSNFIYKVKQYNQLLYVLNSNGLERVDLVNKNSRNITLENSLKNLAINDFEVIGDTAYLATYKGLYKMFIRADHELIEPRVFIKGLKYTDGQDIEVINGKATIKNKPFYIDFDAISFSGDGAISYAYKLQGISNTWEEVSVTADRLLFPALATGEYTFELISINSFGRISLEPAQLTIEILPPLYMQWWFLSIIILLVLSSILLIYNFVKLAYLRKQKNVDQLNHLRLTAIRARMNPHFIYNVMNTIQSLIIIGDKKAATVNLGKFADLMRLILDLSDKQNITFQEEMRTLRLYLELEKLRFDEDFEYNLQVDDELLEINPELPGMLVQPFIENSIKHGLLHKAGEKRLIVKFEIGGQQEIRVTIDDNGIGRKKSEELNSKRRRSSPSFATEAILSRIKLINSQQRRKIVIQILDKVDIDHKASGTTVVLSLPITEKLI